VRLWIRRLFADQRRWSWLVLALGAGEGPVAANAAPRRPQADLPFDRKPAASGRCQRPWQARPGSAGWPSARGARQANLQPMWRHWWGADGRSPHWPSWLSGAQRIPPQWVGSQWLLFAASDRSQPLFGLSTAQALRRVLIAVLLLLFSAPCWLWRPVLIKPGWGPDPFIASARSGFFDKPFMVDQNCAR